MHDIAAEHQNQRVPLDTVAHKNLDFSARCACQSRRDSAYDWQISEHASPPRAPLTATHHALQEPRETHTKNIMTRLADSASRNEHASAPSVLHTIKPTGDKNAAAE